MYRRLNGAPGYLPGLSERDADRWAVALHTHPVLVWPWWQ